MNILLAEDEKAMSMAISAVLTHSGYTVDTVQNGAEAVKAAAQKPYDCLIFDIMMPIKDGVTALSEIRQSGNETPAIFLTAKSEVDDRIMGLDAGADDYLTKPFAMGELLARIRSMTRRRQKDREDLTTGTLTLKVGEGELSCTSSVRLSAKETALMKLLMLNEGKTLSTELLLSHVWQDEEEKGPGVVWIYISYLREKLRAIGSHCTIEGEENGSFRLVSQEAANG